MKNTIKLIANYAYSTRATGLDLGFCQNDGENGNNRPIAASEAVETALPGTLAIPNDADPRSLNLHGITRIDLNFPKFTDGRAYSQAFLLRRRLGFTGEIRATGDVLVDQLVQMQRSGFDAAELREDQHMAHAQRQFDRFSAFYQGDAVTTAAHFLRAA